MQAMPDSLGEFLRARRGQLSPDRVGLPDSGRRRVPGLRREEVALLAGVSVEYYLRLEQGRDMHPSDQVLDSLAAALQLDDDAAAYLHRLAHPAPRPRRRARQQPRPLLQQLLDSWPLTPAYAAGLSGHVVAASRLAVLLCPFFAIGSSPLRAAFLEPAMRDLYPDWDDMTAKAVSGLRAVLSLQNADPGLLETIGELSVASERFRTLWARRDVRARTSGLTRMNHPLAGPLDLNYEKMILPETGELLIAYHAPTGSPTAERLQLLASL